MDKLKLYLSLTNEERRAVHMIISAREDARKREFYKAKAARGEKLPHSWNPDNWTNAAPKEI